MSMEAMNGGPRPLVGPRAMVFMIILTVGVALGITAIFGRPSLWDVLQQGKPWPVQVAWGMGVGLFASVPLVVLVGRVSRFEAFRHQSNDILSRVDLRGFNPLWCSLCAGVGEELLFRGALQPLVGLWLTSLIFTAAHFQTGGFRTMNRMKVLYALLVFLASLLLGAVFVRIGLIAAMVTHTVVDLVALTGLRRAR